MTKHVQIAIAVTEKQQKEILIALLSAAGANGFEEEKDCLKVFIPQDQYNANECKKIIEQNSLKYSISTIEDKNWNAEWEAGFKPVLIGGFCAIRASFHAAIPSVKHDIVITPKMSFGTGHHATTYMMVEAMAGIDFNGKSVFDFGTGTGVLAILAEQLGAATITAIDNDTWSIENAIENFNSNNCCKILLKNEKEFFENSLYDIILANINRNIILENLFSIKQHLSGGGVVLLSGLLTGDEAVIVAEARVHQMALKKRFERDGWICLLMTNSK